MMLVEVALDDPQIARVRSEQEVGDRPYPGDKAEQKIDADVSRHARYLPLRHAEVARFPHHVAAKRRAGDIADSRDEVEYDVEADGAVEPRDHEHPLEQLFHRLDALA